MSLPVVAAVTLPVSLGILSRHCTNKQNVTVKEELYNYGQRSGGEKTSLDFMSGEIVTNSTQQNVIME